MPDDERTEQEPPSAPETIAAALGSAARRAGIDPDADSSTAGVVWKAMGGWRGIVESVLPTLIYIVTYTLTYDLESSTGNLWLSLGLSVGVAAVFVILRLITRSAPSAALGGLVAAAAAAALTLWTGRGEDNFLLGFFTNGAYGAVLLVSALIGWPVIGLIVGFLTGDSTGWRADRRKRRTFFWLTIAWAGLFAARLAVQVPLYFAAEVATLGLTKLAMGLPLFAPMVAVTWLAARALYRRTT